MVAEYDSGRFRDIAETILATNDVQVIEDRKNSALRRLRLLREHSEPIEFAQAQFELACCYFPRHDRRMKERRLRRAEDHYNLALHALSDPVYAVERAIIQSAAAEGYIRLRSTRGFSEPSRDKMNTLLLAAAASFLEADEPADAAVAYTQLAELRLEEGDSTSAREFGDRALSLALSKEGETDVEKVTDLLDRLFRLQKSLAESTNRKLLVDQDDFGAVAARGAVAAIAPQFNEIRRLAHCAPRSSR
jgi:hypothetical protein